MIGEKTKLLIATIKKLHRRGAMQNIGRVLAKTHTADIAEILKAFTPEEQIEIFNIEASAQRRAEVLSYLDHESQLSVVRKLSKEQAVQLFRKMESDDVARLLGQMSDEESQVYLEAMKTEEQQDVVELMGYPEHTAGAMMSSDYLSVNQTLTASETIQIIQQQDLEKTVMFYLYVVNDNEQLVGVLSIKQLLLSKPGEMLESIMIPEVISAKVDTAQQDVAKMVERYDFLAIPVVDESNKLVGVITVDDVIDVIREEANEDLLSMGQAGPDYDAGVAERFKSRFPWVTFAFLGGLICFTTVYFFGPFSWSEPDQVSAWLVVAFLPLMLAVGATTGHQSVTMTVGAIKSGQFDMWRPNSHWVREIILSLIFSGIFATIVGIAGYLVFSGHHLALIMSSSLAIQIIFSMLIGNFLPVALKNLGLDPTVGSIPLFTVIADVSAIGILTLFLRAFSG